MLDAILQFVPGDCRKAYVGLLTQVPRHVRSLCTLGDSGPALGYLLKKRPGTRALSIVGDPAAIPVASRMVDDVSLPGDEPQDFSLCEIDAVVLSNLETDYSEVLKILGALLPALTRNTAVYALLGDPGLPTGGEGPSHEELAADLQVDFERLGFRMDGHWPMEAAGRRLACLMRAVHLEYSPVDHARTFLARGEFSFAYEILSGIPRSEAATADEQIIVHWARLETIRDWLNAEPDPADLSNKLMAAQESFYFITYALPEDPAAYQAMAGCWAAANDHDMAQRIRRTAPDPGGAGELPLEHHVGTPRVESVPSWKDRTAPRILILMNPRPHYGIDVLYDGLCACLGDEQVVDYPFKPWLHGKETEQLKHYPCRFDLSLIHI